MAIVNVSFQSVLEHGGRAEDVEQALRDLGWEDISALEAYGGHCTTLRAIQP